MVELKEPKKLGPREENCIDDIKHLFEDMINTDEPQRKQEILSTVFSRIFICFHPHPTKNIIEEVEKQSYDKTFDS